jgi:hypothetical protein
LVREPARRLGGSDAVAAFRDVASPPANEMAARVDAMMASLPSYEFIDFGSSGDSLLRVQSSSVEALEESRALGDSVGESLDSAKAKRRL